MLHEMLMEQYADPATALLAPTGVRAAANAPSPAFEIDPDVARSGYAQHCRPELARLLRALRLDAVYVRAEGNYLWRAEGSSTIKTLDLVGGYGAGLFGHYHPELVEQLTEAVRSRVPFLAQGSCRAAAAELAAELARMAGDDYLVCFTNSGTETVEAALKHLQLERGRGAIVGLTGAFHGKTLGAIQLTSAYRAPYAHWSPDIRSIDPWDAATWPALESALGEIAGVFVEPMLGEGGVRPLPQAFIDWLNLTIVPAGIPIIADEVQTGMGRTGSFLLCTQLGLKPDYICLSKSLGGGLAKIGALLIRRSRYVPEFSIQHSSTFAEDDLSCRIALKALALLERDRLPQRCKELGAHLLKMLEKLRAQYPGVIKEVRGQGLMVGLELHDLTDSASKALRAVSTFEYLGYVAAAYLLNHHNIRVAPTLSSRNTLRIAPSAYISTAELDKFGLALAQLCEILSAGDVGHLFRPRTAWAPRDVVNRIAALGTRREPAKVARRVAFVGHLIEPSDLAIADPSLAGLSESELQLFVDDTAEAVGPVIYEQHHVRSITGEQVHLSFIGLNLYSKQIAQAWRKRKAGWIRESIRSAVELARDNGCQVVGLGGYTSIVTHNCEAVVTPGIELTSGNALTAGMGILALKQAAAQQGIELHSARLAIVGATGNIASIYAAMLAREVAELVLVVRDVTASKVGIVCNNIRAAAPDIRITVTDDMHKLRGCTLIVTASNAAQPLIHPEHLSDAPTAICDISVPSDVAATVATQKPNVLVLQGGNVRLPHDPDFGIHGVRLEAGHVFACMAETLLMGLEGGTMSGSQGSLSFAGVETALAMAAKHGFSLGGFRTFQTI